MIEFEPEVLNAALELATEWGEHFRTPISERMSLRFPLLSEQSILEIEKFVRKAESRIYEIAELEHTGQILESDISRIAASEFPWMETGNIARLKNIGMYYARR